MTGEHVSASEYAILDGASRSTKVHSNDNFRTMLAHFCCENGRVLLSVWSSWIKVELGEDACDPVVSMDLRCIILGA